LPHHPARGVIREFLVKQLSPSGVMVEVPDDQWNVDVAAFAYWLAIVYRFKNGK